MEGERRKRKILEEEEENDEEKMEKFFALIKSTRDLLSKPDKKVDEEKKEKTIWNPTFQLEDFIGSEELGKSNVSVSVTHDTVAGPSSRKEKEVMIIEKECVQEAAATTTIEAPSDQNEDKEKQKASDNGLDLNLSL
ncbi:hypothetical protein TSUD_344110 [Trifolium subterraneum]|nr:hypothetical protein TSUD_344110 [Trifolium subterraneum]